jgi:hypothetical protein
MPVVLTMVPAPVAGLMLHVTPELEESFATAAPVKACGLLSPRVVVAGLMAPTLIGISGIVSVAVLLGSVLLVAVITAVAVVTGNGAL